MGAGRLSCSISRAIGGREELAAAIGSLQRHKPGDVSTQYSAATAARAQSLGPTVSRIARHLHVRIHADALVSF